MNHHTDNTALFSGQTPHLSGEKRSKESELASRGASQLTRREALKITLLFSASMLATPWLGRLRGAIPETASSGEGLHFLAFGDFGSRGNANQVAVARQMEAFAKGLNKPLTAVLALGDNFYGNLQPERFKIHFEDLYSEETLNCPFYAVLGNHDYGPHYDSKQGRPKAQMQLDYAMENPQSRFKLPSRWYAREFPEHDPLVKMIFLDGNTWEGALTPEEKIEQRHFLKEELKKETKASWVWVVTHFPLFTQTTRRRESKSLIREWGELLKEHNISLFISGHDHNLQHLRVEGYDTDFVISGAGGAALYEATNDRGFSQQVLGFNHLYVTRDFFEVKFLDTDGNLLHQFRNEAKKKADVG